MCYKTNLASCISMEINSVGIWNLHRVKIEIIIVVCKIYRFKYFCEILVWNLSYKMIWLPCNQRKLIFLNSSIFNYFRIPNRCQLQVTCPFWHLSFCSFSMYRFQNSTCNLMASYSLNFVDFFFISKFWYNFLFFYFWFYWYCLFYKYNYSLNSWLAILHR